MSSFVEPGERSQDNQRLPSSTMRSELTSILESKLRLVIKTRDDFIFDLDPKYLPQPSDSVSREIASVSSDRFFCHRSHTIQTATTHEPLYLTSNT